VYIQKEMKQGNELSARQFAHSQGEQWADRQHRRQRAGK
jgi:hypothetical protein